MPDKCPDNPRDCPLLPRVEALERDSVHNKEAHKEFYARLDDSHTSVAVIEQRLEQIKEDTAEIKEAQQAVKASVQELRDKPGRRWDSLVDKAIWAVAAAVITYLLAGAGLWKGDNMTDITPIIEAVIALIGAVITAVIIPYIRSRTTAQQQDELYAWVKIAVLAAEQLYKGSGRGSEKKAYVLEWLNDHGVTVDEGKLNAMIEAAVLELNNGIFK